MKKYALFHIIFAIFAVFALMSKPTNSFCLAENNIEEELGESVNETIENIDFSQLESFLIESGISENFFNGQGVKDVLSSILFGNFDGDVFSILKHLFNVSFGYIKQYLSALMVVLVIILICFMFNKLKTNIQKDSIEEVIYFVCFAAIITLLVGLSKGVIENAVQSLTSMQKQMNMVLPILLSLMTMLGATSSVAAFTPIVGVLSTLISNVFVYILLPIFFLIFTLSLINNISKNAKFNKLISFFNSLFKWIIGVVFSVFFMFFTMQGLTVATTDGITLKAAKFAIKNYVPLLGGYVSDGFEIAKAGIVLVKNAVGIVGVIIMIASVITPIIVIAVFSLLLKFFAGILEPLGDNRCVDILCDVGSSFKLLLTCVLVVSLMYIVTIFLMISAVSGVLS